MSNNSHRSRIGKVTKADLIWSALMVITIFYAAGSGLLP